MTDHYHRWGILAERVVCLGCLKVLTPGEIFSLLSVVQQAAAHHGQIGYIATQALRRLNR